MAENEGEAPMAMTKPKVVVIMGPTGSGKSRLAIDLASHFPIEIINADSMQVYRGLDVLTNKVTPLEQKGVPHHLLGTISPNVEFTSKDFRDAAIPLISDIISRDHVPVIVGGTNFYIQALVSPFLLDESVEDLDDSCLTDISDAEPNWREHELDVGEGSGNCSYDRLKTLDPVAAKRIHPNDHRKIKQYLALFDRSGILPSKLFQGKMIEKWGRDINSRYNCCFICVDASLPVLDRFVDQRVDRMIEAGLLDEVYDIYTLNADYTRGLRQAIGVREFNDFLSACFSDMRREKTNSSEESASLIDADSSPRLFMREVLNSSSDNSNRRRLEEAIDKFKVNTRRLVRRQKRRINRLQTLFGWKIHSVDSTESLLGSSADSWNAQVVEPAAKAISSFLNVDANSVSISHSGHNNVIQRLEERDLWTQYICKACGNRVLRGAHEWEKHKQGRGHRKRIANLRKRQGAFSTGSHHPQPQGTT